MCTPISIVLGEATCESSQNSRKCREIRITWTQGHSRSSNLAPIKRVSTTSY